MSPCESLVSLGNAPTKDALARAKAAAQAAASASATQGQAVHAPVVAPDTVCKRNACGKRFDPALPADDPCTHHPGAPVFHDGSVRNTNAPCSSLRSHHCHYRCRYWSCCRKRAADFDEFLSQRGCTTDVHKWLADEATSKAVEFRTQWFQTGGSASLSVFAKLIDPDHCLFEANPSTVSFSLWLPVGVLTSYSCVSASLPRAARFLSASFL